MILVEYAKGKYCPKCGHVMQARDERQVGPKRWWVYYVCLNQNCKHTTHDYE